MEALLDKYEKQLTNFKSSSIGPLLQSIKIWDLDSDPNFEQGKSIDPSVTLAVGSEVSNAQALKAIREFGVMHVLQSSKDDFVYEIFASALMLKQPQKFMGNPLPFFLRSSSADPLKENLQRKKVFGFASTKDKEMINQELSDWLNEEKSTQVFVTTVLTIANELILNALFDAPVDKKSGAHLHVKKDRGTRIEYPIGTVGKLLLAHDDKRLFIACEDPYGSVNFGSVAHRLYSFYFQNDQSPVGLGVRMVVDNSSGIYFLKQHMKRTYVCCSFPLGMGLRRALDVPKSFHFCKF